MKPYSSLFLQMVASESDEQKPAATATASSAASNEAGSSEGNAANSQIVYPKARRDDSIVDELHGVKVIIKSNVGRVTSVIRQTSAR